MIGRVALAVTGVVLLCAALAKGALPSWAWVVVRWRLARWLITLAIVVMLAAAADAWVGAR